MLVAEQIFMNQKKCTHVWIFYINSCKHTLNLIDGIWLIFICLQTYIACLFDRAFNEMMNE